MFDGNNQSILAKSLSDEARLAIRLRLIEGGASLDYIEF